MNKKLIEQQAIKKVFDYFDKWWGGVGIHNLDNYVMYYNNYVEIKKKYLKK